MTTDPAPYLTAAYPLESMGVSLLVSDQRMRARLAHDGPGDPFVGGDTFRLYRFKKRLQRVAEWLAARFERQHGFVMAADGAHLTLTTDAVIGATRPYRILVRLDGFRPAPEHADIMRTVMLAPTARPGQTIGVRYLEVPRAAAE